MLADLLPGLESAVRADPESRHPDVYELLAVAYQSCSAALARMNEPDAAWIAADRAMAAAERAGNLLLVAAGSQRLAAVFLGARHYALAEETARTTVAALQELAELGDPDAVALCGSLTLLRAVIAARTGRAAAAYYQLASARRRAARLCPEQVEQAEFGPDYVTLYEIAVSVDLGDAGHALRVAGAGRRPGCRPATAPGCWSTWPGPSRSASRSTRRRTRWTGPRPPARPMSGTATGPVSSSATCSRCGRRRRPWAAWPPGSASAS